MLRITNGEKTLVVPRGAFREIYSPSGWVVVSETPAMPSQESAVAPVRGGDSKYTPETPEAPEGSKGGEDPEEDILHNMSEMELRQYASLLGIKTKSLNTREKLMRAIREHK